MYQSGTRTAFIVTKPSQLMVALTILNESALHGDVTILFCDSFYDARNVECRFKRAVKPRILSNFCKNRIHAIKFAASQGFDVLYIDSDVGVQHYIALLGFRLRNPFCRVNVFEEGLGPYTEDTHTGLQRAIRNILGIGSNFGGSVFTSCIYLYNPDEYIAKFPKQSKKAILIRTPIWAFIGKNHKVLEAIFGIDNYSEDNKVTRFCYIYMTGHHIDNEFLTNFKSNEGKLFIKYHPHIGNPLEVDGVQVLSTSTPIEYILYELLCVYDKIIIYDHNSAARRYVLDSRVSFRSIH